VAQFASFGFCKAHAAAFAVPTYRSAWLKTHYRAHFLAGVLTHDPGMYPRRLILDDARRAGIPVLPLDVNRSEPDYVAEEADATGTFGIRLALQDVHGISDAEIRSILEGRAARMFRDVGDFVRRTTVSRPVVEALAHAGAFDALGGTNRRGHLYDAITVAAPREGDQLTLAEAAMPAHRFADYTDAEVVRAELEVLGIDATRHLVSFYEPLLADLGVTRSADLARRRQDEWVMVAGVKIAQQTPAVRSGQRIVFVSLDDATGPIEVTVFEAVQPRVARTVFHAYALAVWGQLRRTGVKGVSVIAQDVWDLAALQLARREGRLRDAMASPVAPAAGATRRLWHSSPGSAG
jgi:error-prone DNA polymerase